MRKGRWTAKHISALKPIIAEINAETDAAEASVKEFQDSEAAFNEIGRAFGIFIKHRKFVPDEFAERINGLLNDWVKRAEWTANKDETENYFGGIADGLYWRTKYKAESERLKAAA